MSSEQNQLMIQRISVIGAGIMGHGIAQEFAAAGNDVMLTDAFPEALERARVEINANLVDHPDRLGILERLILEPDFETAVAKADFVVEAVPEKLELKQRIFEELDRATPSSAILASNTSSFMPSQLAPSTSRPDKVLVTHYFNPPHVVPLVEIVRGPDTSKESVESVRSLYERIGKTPVVMQIERLGFIGNRLQNALFREALSLVDSGVCSIEDIDTVMHTSIGRRWSVAGIFEVFDLAGLDTVFAVAEQVFPDLSNASTPPASWVSRVKAGNTGIKSGRGFYDWTEESGATARQRIRTGLKATGKDIELEQ
jgi:3-hydroxybutyryl-CoA dehydrogenase